MTCSKKTCILLRRFAGLVLGRQHRDMSERDWARSVRISTPQGFHSAAQQSDTFLAEIVEDVTNKLHVRDSRFPAPGVG